MTKRPFERGTARREPGRRVLIACEGQATEPGYFHDIRIDLRLSAGRVFVIPHQGTDPLTIVRAAISERESQKQKRDWTDEDEAWAVFDCDEHRDVDPARWNTAIDLARRHDISLAVSSPSFELWYLLHYQDQWAYLTRQDALSQLRKHLPDYEKAHPIYRSRLKARTENAMNRADELDRRADKASLGPYSNPSTAVSALVRLLLHLGSSG